VGSPEVRTLSTSGLFDRGVAPAKRLHALDALRAIAVSWVVCVHAREMLPGLPPYLRLLADGGLKGVDLFFVLSGFLIGRILFRELSSTQRIDVRRFWQRRWLRTLPAYYVTLVAVAASTFVRPGSLPWVNPLAYAIFGQNYVSVGSHFNWSWSLCVEEHFYLALPLILLAAAKAGLSRRPAVVLRAIAGIAIAVSVLARHIMMWSTPANDWGTYERLIYCPTHMRLDGLAVGLFLATLPPLALSRWAAAGTAACGIAFVAASTLLFPNASVMTWQGFFLTAIAFGAIVLSLLGRASWMDVRVPGAAWVADLSYSLYLFHPSVFAFVETKGTRLGALALPVALLSSVGIAYVVRRWVELPMLRLRDRRTPELTMPVASADAT
jgi:peptidoglycan/LPS O-acetylase OafA/YrhL